MRQPVHWRKLQIPIYATQIILFHNKDIMFINIFCFILWDTKQLKLLVGPCTQRLLKKSLSAASFVLFSASFILCITMCRKFALSGHWFYFIGSISFIHLPLKIFPSDPSLQFICNLQYLSIRFLLEETLPKICCLKLFPSSLKGGFFFHVCLFFKRKPFCFIAREILEENCEII